MTTTSAASASEPEHVNRPLRKRQRYQSNRAAKDVADEVVLVQPLHDDDDGAVPLVVEPAVEDIEEPLVAGLPTLGCGDRSSREQPSAPMRGPATDREGPRVCRLSAGGSRIRTVGPRLSEVLTVGHVGAAKLGSLPVERR
jgi:hypothetical protein